MSDEYAIPLVRLSLALVAGSLIGLERTYHGRPADFRTHILVSTASGLLMLLTVSSAELITEASLEIVRIDPTRMAQGIMTGIGFLGAGVIVKEGLTIRGLTTAGSIWITASIGIMVGVGLYFAAFVAEVITVGSLSLLGLLETRVPALQYGRLEIRQPREAAISESELISMIASHSITYTDINYHLYDKMFEYEITLRTRNVANFGELADTLKGLESAEFKITPTGT